MQAWLVIKGHGNWGVERASVALVAGDVDATAIDDIIRIGAGIAVMPKPCSRIAVQRHPCLHDFKHCATFVRKNTPGK